MPSHVVVALLLVSSTSGSVVPATTNPGILQRPIDRFCRATNAAFRQTVFPSLREYVDIKDADESSPTTYKTKALAAPEAPGIARPVSMVIFCSVPTLLGWYGYYKYSIEEELFHDEIRTTGFASGCGGYGTLFPFVYCVLIGGLATLVGLPGGEEIIGLGATWILLGQVNLYRRVNELCRESLGEEPLHAWWALLPPPFDVIVGLRQIHFLARHWAKVRGTEWEVDPVAEEYFPFIDAPRFTLKELAKKPSIWFWFTKGASDLELPILK